VNLLTNYGAWRRQLIASLPAEKREVAGDLLDVTEDILRIGDRADFEALCRDLLVLKDRARRQRAAKGPGAPASASPLAERAPGAPQAARWQAGSCSALPGDLD
jgi:hypothetical protein